MNDDKNSPPPWQSEINTLEENFRKLTQTGKKKLLDELSRFYLRQDRSILREIQPLFDRLIGPSFVFQGLREYSCGEEKNLVLRYRHVSTEMDFILLPGGEFEMGSPHFPQAQPLRKVKVNPFLMGKFLVSCGAWKKLMSSEPWESDEQPSGENYPARGFSWSEIHQFCQDTGLRLPSEAQWEYACRGNGKSPYFWGSKEEKEDYVHFERKGLHKIGDKKPNPFGLYDMLGNLREICGDHWHKNYQGAPPYDWAWVDPEFMGHERYVLRGGSWRDRLWESGERWSPQMDLDSLEGDHSPPPDLEDRSLMGIRLVKSLE